MRRLINHTYSGEFLTLGIMDISQFCKNVYFKCTLNFPSSNKYFAKMCTLNVF